MRIKMLAAASLSFVLLFAGSIMVSSPSAFAGDESSIRSFKVGGMDCEMCPKSMEKAVKKIKGVEEAKVELNNPKDPKEGGILKVKAPETVTDAQIIEAVKKADKNFTCERIPQ